ncbi:peptide/nickel transport system permease protein [Malonomonas rubra DSM 5091]|uniref:Peptide/nickel transport system permease protein n=1 Tax=Malonomonas rubra DSM 5091 TaxID=1122189 RepID=A0A1M6FF46_MALRU|nr:ABC transporter permease [Malonomonas rubra]SHI96252.1 peptide/nickel transport system permease protein [Malonomonas rubra DSM 5091]
MLNYAIRRLLLLIPLLIFVSLFVFAILKLTPGDPATALLGDQATEEAIALARAKYALDEPLPVQYVHMMANFFNGDLQSIFHKDNVLSVVLHRLPATLELGLLSLLIAVIVSIPVGIISAVKRNSFFDYASMSMAMFGVSIPVFFTGILLIYLFAVILKWLPASGYGGHFWTIEGLRHMILPALSLSFVLMASTTRLTRSAMLEVIHQDYIRTARAKGVSRFMVVMFHAFKNALIPIATNIGNQVARMFAGAVLTETVFAWPGVGRLAVNAIFRRDEPLVFGCVLLMAVVYVVINLLVDLLYGFLNPQISYD